MRSDATVSAMVNTFVWVPVAMVVVMAALLFFYDLDKRGDRVGGSSPPVACSAKAIGISVESGHASSGCAPGLVGVGL